ncbi:uncharacterized protein LOC127528853 [Erpetoichthys calabaricus]|uniref:uncharacterized protein LOC127528853 n=1 Tax=Erpetoichthys calabaricus TaxID=27687 RepID=UPI0022343E52|nr:uncharacterized protein LOC127528853 [Erpetoichthys calabaricus]
MVREQARRRVRAAGGDPGDSKLVRSASELQFGQYRGQTFKWLLTHDLGYAVMVLATHLRERKDGQVSDSPLASNKNALESYAWLFPDVKKAIRRRQERDGSARTLDEGKRLVGFGQHGHLTFEALYDTEDREAKSYIKWLRRQTTKVGTKMHALQLYVQRRDKAKAAATSSLPKTTTVAPTASLSAAASVIEIPDDVLLSASMELEAGK